jgi:hypothetical protein
VLWLAALAGQEPGEPSERQRVLTGDNERPGIDPVLTVLVGDSVSERLSDAVAV